MDKNYLDTLKNINMRPKKVKVIERKEVILNEQNDMKDMHNKIIDFFRKNPNPDDKQIGKLAEEWGMEEPELENHIYKVLTSYINKTDSTLKESKFLQELFVQTGEIDNMPKGKERDLRMARLSMIAELDAVNLYDHFAELASDKKFADVMIDVSNEEKVHAGEFQTLVENIDPAYEDFEDEGKGEVEKKTGIKTD